MGRSVATQDAASLGEILGRMFSPTFDQSTHQLTTTHRYLNLQITNFSNPLRYALKHQIDTHKRYHKLDTQKLFKSSKFHPFDTLKTKIHQKDNTYILPSFRYHRSKKSILRLLQPQFHQKRLFNQLAQNTSAIPQRNLLVLQDHTTNKTPSTN